MTCNVETVSYADDLNLHISGKTCKWYTKTESAK